MTSHKAQPMSHSLAHAIARLIARAVVLTVFLHIACVLLLFVAGAWRALLVQHSDTLTEPQGTWGTWTSGVIVANRTSMMGATPGAPPSTGIKAWRTRLVVDAINVRPRPDSERMLIAWSGLIGPSLHDWYVRDLSTATIVDSRWHLSVPWTRGDSFLVPTRPTWWLLFDFGVMALASYSGRVLLARARAASRRRRERREGTRVCPKCGYTLGGLSRCPECATEMH